MPHEASRSLRDSLRDGLVTLAAAFTAPLWLGCWLEARRGGEGWFAGCSELLSLVPGKPGIFLRRGFYRQTLDACSTDCHIGFGTTLAHRQARIGRGVYVGPKCTLGRVVLEDHVTIGSNVDILSGRHQHGFDDPSRPIQKQARRFEQISIGANSWLGNSSVVMADIGPHCVIGAGSVVVKAIPSGSLAVGNPAVVKRSTVVRPPRETPAISTETNAEEALEETPVTV